MGGVHCAPLERSICTISISTKEMISTPAGRHVYRGKVVSISAVNEPRSIGVDWQSYGTRRVPTTFNVYLFLEFTIIVFTHHVSRYQRLQINTISCIQEIPNAYQKTF